MFFNSYTDSMCLTVPSLKHTMCCWTFSCAHTSPHLFMKKCTLSTNTEWKRNYRPKQNWKTQYCAQKSSVLIKTVTHTLNNVCECVNVWMCDDCAATAVAFAFAFDFIAVAAAFRRKQKHHQRDSNKIWTWNRKITIMFTMYRLLAHIFQNNSKCTKDELNMNMKKNRRKELSK